MITHSNHHSAPDARSSKSESEDLSNFQKSRESWLGSNIKYLAAGAISGIVFVKAEIISWYRIQEMFRFDSFHMYGIIGSAVVTATLSVYLIKFFGLKTIQGEHVQFPEKKFHVGMLFGGLLFGLGWALTGACPGPLFAQATSGYPQMSVTILSALAGTWTYGLLREKLPH